MKRKIVSSITALYFAICCCFTVCVVYNAVSCANKRYKILPGKYHEFSFVIKA